MAELKVNYSGSWRTITAPEVKYSGSWRAIKTIEVNYGGAWRTVFASAWATTVTLGTLNNIYTTGTWHVGYTYLDAYGYDGGIDYYNYATNKGSIGDATYTDGSPTTRTITSVLWSQTGFVIFTLSGTSIPDTAATFVSIDLNGNNYLRSGATYVASLNGGTHWYWAEASNPWGSSSGTYDFGVNI